MEKIVEGYVERHENTMVKCPKCDSVDVIAKTEDGYFFVIKCNNCDYQKKRE